MLLHASSQVPDFNSVSVDCPKHSSPARGPHDIIHSFLNRCEAQHWSKVILTPKLNGPVCRTAEEDVWTKRWPCDLIDRTLMRLKQYVISSWRPVRKWKSVLPMDKKTKKHKCNKTQNVPITCPIIILNSRLQPRKTPQNVEMFNGVNTYARHCRSCAKKPYI